MSDEEFDEESFRAYEDELYGQNSNDSDDESVDSEIEETLYSQVHYSFSLPQDEDNEIIEVSSQTTDQDSLEELLKDKEETSSVIAISSDEADSVSGKSRPKENWELDETDLDDGSNVKSYKSVSRYYKTPKKSMYIRCHNCNERGHMAYECPDPKKISKCNLCGDEGHLRRYCPNELCFNCDEPGHQSRSCRKPRRRYYDQCLRCFLAGHTKTDCPDHWRQYHRTVKTGKIVKPSETPVPARPMFCYNCAQKGHYGHECTEDRMEPRQAASFPFVIHYDGCPSNANRRGQGEGGEKKRKGGDKGKGQWGSDDSPKGFKSKRDKKRDNSSTYEERSGRDFSTQAAQTPRGGQGNFSTHEGRTPHKGHATHQKGHATPQKGHATYQKGHASQQRNNKGGRGFSYVDEDYHPSHAAQDVHSRLGDRNQDMDDRRSSWPQHQRQQYTRNSGEYPLKDDSWEEDGHSVSGKKGRKRFQDDSDHRPKRKKQKVNDYPHTAFDDERRDSNMQIMVQADSNTKRIVEMSDNRGLAQNTSSSPQGTRRVVQHQSKNKKSNNRKVNRLVNLSEDWDDMNSSSGFSRNTNSYKTNRGFRQKKKLGHKSMDKRFTL